MDFIEPYIQKVNPSALQDTLFYLSKEPLTCRILNYARPGQEKCTLYETDDYIEFMLKARGYSLEAEAVPVQCCVSDEKLSAGFRIPNPHAPWFKANNQYARKSGQRHPKELIIVIAYKDSQSWLTASPGAYYNAVGVSAVLEIARILADYRSERTIWFVFCNREVWPLTSVTVAERVAKSDFETIGVLNLDGLGGKSPKDNLFGRLSNVTRYSTAEGEAIADLSFELNQKLEIGLNQKKYFYDQIDDDDGSFINAGIKRAVMNTGSFPFAEPNYHTVNDMAENVDIQNLKLATQLSLATVLYWDAHGKVD